MRLTGGVGVRGVGSVLGGVAVVAFAAGLFDGCSGGGGAGGFASTNGGGAGGFANTNGGGAGQAGDFRGG